MRDINAKVTKVNTFLHIAAYRGYKDTITLLSKGADVNCLENDNWTTPILQQTIGTVMLFGCFWTARQTSILKMSKETHLYI